MPSTSPFLMRLFDVRQNPVLHVAMDLRAAMHQRHPRAVAPQVQRRNRRRILSPDDHHILS